MKTWKRFRGFVWDVEWWLVKRRGPECTLGMMLFMRKEEGFAWRDVFRQMGWIVERDNAR